MSAPNAKVSLPPDAAAIFDKLIKRHGIGNVARELGCNRSTIDALIDGGKARPAVVERIAQKLRELAP